MKKFREFMIIVILSIVFATIWHFSFNVDLLNPNQWKNTIMFCSVPVGLTIIEIALRYNRGKQSRILSSTTILLIMGLISAILAFLLTAVSATTMNIVEAETLALGSSSFGVIGYILECLVYMIGALLYFFIIFHTEEKKVTAQAETEA